MIQMNNIIYNHKKAGFHFFDKNALPFFKSRIGKTIYKDKYFITSEQFGLNSPRLFTVRKYNREDCSIETVGEFQAFKSKGQALRFIETLE